MQHPLWHKIPLVRLLVPFACGIVFSLFTEGFFGLAATGFLLFFAASVYIHYTLERYSFRWVYGVCISLCVFAGGWALNQHHNELRSDTHYGLVQGAEYLLVKVDDEPVRRRSGYKFTVTALQVTDSCGLCRRVTGKLAVFIGEKNPGVVPVYGDVLMIPFGKIAPIKGPQNPDEFDFKKYLALKQIYFQVYLKGSDIRLTGDHRGYRVMQYVYRIQAYFKDVLARYIGSQNESAVAQALLYGDDDDIDTETMQAYANTGTLHVLAVSGMHVGIIYMILGLLLAPLGRFKKGKMIKQLVILLLLWVYSLICGMSPSILRATVMFTFIIIAGVMDEHSSVYNTLAASALVLLCYDTNLIANVGFQLSYLAVLGIVFFQPFIVTWYTAPNWFLHQVWSVTAVSLAAQLITFPIGLYYFHQFPNCFLLSNLLIIPLTTVILYGGILLLLISGFSWLAWLLGQALFYLIRFTNHLVKWIEQIPYAYVNGIEITIVQSVLLYLVIFLATLYLIRQQKIFLKAALCSAVVFFGLKSYNDITNLMQARMVVYHIPDYNAIHWIVGNNALFFADTSLVTNTPKIKFHLQQHLWKSGIKQQSPAYADSMLWQKISISGHSVLVSGREPVTDSMFCDLLVVKNRIDPAGVFRFIQTKQVCITAAVKPADAKTLLDFCRNRNIAAEYVGEKGAIQLSLLR